MTTLNPSADEHQAGWLARYQTPVRGMGVLALALFTAEIVVMNLLALVPPLAPWVHYALDATMMLVIALPAMLLFVVQPLHRQIERRQLVEAELRRHRESLEQTVEERTAELKRSNRQLQETIAECHRTEAALRASEVRYRTLFETMNEGLAIQELACVSVGGRRDCRIVEVNPAFERLTGIPAGNAVGRSLRQLLPSFDPACIDRFCEVGASGLPDHVETYVEELDKWFELHSSYTQPGRLALVLVDITARKLAEQALAESRRDLSRAQAVAHTGNWSLDLKKNQLVWSDETYRIFGLPIGAALSYEKFLQQVHPDDRERVDAAWKAAVAGNRYDIDHRIIAGSAVKWVREKAELDFDHRGELRGGFGTVQDISELKMAEAALAESERRYRELVELSPDGIVVQREHRCVFANTAAMLLLGIRQPRELVQFGWDICAFVRAADQPATSIWLDRVEQEPEGTVPSHECQLAIPGRPLIYAEIRGKRIQFEGTPSTQIIFRDITERKRVLAERERLLAQLASERAILNVTMENTRAHLAYLDPQFNFLHVNSAFERGCGYAREQLIGRNHFDLFPSAENEAIFRAVRDTGAPAEFFAKPFENSKHPERGVTFWDWTLVCMRNPLGHVDGLVLSLMDVTAAKRAEVALRESEERIHAALQVGRMFTFEWDPRSDLVIRSPHCAEILGIEGDATRDTGRDFFARVHPDDRSRFELVLKQLAPASDRYRTTYRVLRPGRDAAILEEAARGFFDENGKLLRLSGVTADVTQREQAQLAELSRLGRAATINHLAASLAHELRQPLTGIMSNAEAASTFLRLLPPDLNEVREALDDIINNTERASEVIQRLRALHRNAGTERNPLDLNRVIEDTMDLLRSELIFRHVSFHLHLDPNLPDSIGNRVELQQVIINLVLNSAEAMEEVPPAERSLTIATTLVDGTLARVTVTDTGQGITPTVAARLFEPFFTTKPSGMGMGLNVCQSIIQAHGGRIWTDRNIPRGTSFHFTVPTHP